MHRAPARRFLRKTVDKLRVRWPGPTATAFPLTVNRRVITMSGLAVVTAVAASLCARLLTWLIGIVTNLAFYGRISSAFSSPAGNTLGAWVIVVPIVGGLVVGVMARYGSKAI